MELALIDDDTLYQMIFKDYLFDYNISITLFTSGESFLKVPPNEAMQFGCIVIDHTLCDMTGVQLVKYIKPALESEICLISTYGDALTDVEKKGLGVSGDYKRTDLEGILEWYNYFALPVQKKITN